MLKLYIISNRHGETSRDKIQEHWMIDDRTDCVVITITFCKNCFIIRAPDCNLTLKLSIFIKQCSKLRIAISVMSTGSSLVHSSLYFHGPLRSKYRYSIQKWELNKFETTFYRKPNSTPLRCVLITLTPLVIS